MDIIDVSPDDLVLPGDCLGGTIGLGRIGPFNECGGPWFPAAGRADPYGEMWCEEHGSRCSDSAPLALYDCRDEWLRDRLRRVLAAGERCGCNGLEYRGHGEVRDCSHCNGTGYTRQPHDLGHFIDAEIAGRIPPLVAAGLWWASVLRVEAGLGPVAGLLGEWQHNSRDTLWTDRRDSFIQPLRYALAFANARGWTLLRWSGPETGDAGKLAADTAALSAGFALLNGDHILLPLPDRIARLRLEG